MFQRTINRSISTEGVGIHSGKKVRLNLYPAEANTGICFRRSDIDTDFFNIDPSCIKQTVLCTGVYKNGVEIKTIEHLMAALYMLGIDNILIEVDSYEIPIMDGSSAPFIFLIKDVGIKNLESYKKVVKVKKEISYTEGDKYVVVRPSNSINIDYRIDFENNVIKNSNQRLNINLFKNNIVNHLANARTFGFIRDVEYLQKNGLAKGGSLSNAIIIDDYRVINDEGLRYEDEFVRHKMLDMLGDIFVCGKYIIGDFCAYKSGHYMNNMFLREIF